MNNRMEELNNQQEEVDRLRSRNRAAVRTGTLTQRMAVQLNREDERLMTLARSANVRVNRAGRLEL